MWPFCRKADGNGSKGDCAGPAGAHGKPNERLLRLGNDDCAIGLHGDGKVEVIFTKAYDTMSQAITPNEETLMAIACFMRQPGFLEMIRDEFRKIAMERISTLTDNLEKGDQQKR